MPASVGLLTEGCAPKNMAAEASFVMNRSLEANESGILAYKNGDYKKALDKFMEALQIDRSTGNIKGELYDLLNTGRVFIAMDQHPKAVIYLHEALRLAGALENDDALCQAQFHLATVLYYQDEYAEALKSLDKSMAIDARSGIKSGAKLNLKGMIYTKLGSRSDSLVILKDALEINVGAGDAIETANSYRAIGNVHRIENHIEQAISSYKLAYDIDRVIGHTHMVAVELEYMAELHVKLGLRKEALKLFEKAYVVNLNAGFYADAVGNLDRMIDIYRLMKDAQSVTMYSKMKDSILSESSIVKPGARK